MDSKPTRAECSIDDSRQYARTILDSLSAHIAIIDHDGMILETNQAWKHFAQTNKIRMRPDTLNVNYLDICDSAHGEFGEAAHAVADGIRAVIKEEVDEFVLDYSCHSPEEKRWFYMRAIRAVGAGPLRVVISHENITSLKMAEERLKKREMELDQERARLEDANAALRAILRQLEEDKREQTMFQNLREAVLPHFQRLKGVTKGTAGDELVALIESGLNNLTSPFLRRLYSLDVLLTPQDIQIANVIKEGMTTKDIARLLNLSIATISFHRRNLRDKLRLKNRGTNLRTHLLSLSD